MLAEAFADKGYMVHCFVFVESEQNDFASFTKHNNITEYRYYPNQKIYTRFFVKMIRKSLHIMSLKKIPLRFFWGNILHWLNFYAVKKWFKKHGIVLDFCIGVEKGGVTCAYELWKLFGVPYFYFSLELYLESDNCEYDPVIMALRPQERRAHAVASGVLVQDEQRGNILYASNQVDRDKVPMCLFPISMRKPNICLQSDIIKNQKTKQLLIFGNSRMTEDEFVNLSCSLPQDYMILYHNRGDSCVQSLVEKHALKQVVISTSDLDEEEISKLIDNARIGLCWYVETIENNRLTAFASEKLTRCLSHGIPVIANAKTNFPELFFRYACGIAVNDVTEIPQAIQMIEENYVDYTRQALTAFDNIYNFEKNFVTVESFISASLKKSR